MAAAAPKFKTIFEKASTDPKAAQIAVSALRSNTQRSISELEAAIHSRAPGWSSTTQSTFIERSRYHVGTCFGAIGGPLRPCRNRCGYDITNHKIASWTATSTRGRPASA